MHCRSVGAQRQPIASQTFLQITRHSQKFGVFFFAIKRLFGIDLQRGVNPQRSDTKYVNFKSLYYGNDYYQNSRN